MTSQLDSEVDISTIHPVGAVGRWKFSIVSDSEVSLEHAHSRIWLVKVEKMANISGSSSQVSNQWSGDGDIVVSL